MLSQGGLCAAAVNFYIYFEFYNGIMQFLCLSTAFLLVFVCRLQCQKAIGPKYEKEEIRSHI